MAARSIGLIEYSTTEKHTMTRYEFIIDDGKLAFLHCYDYYSHEAKFKYSYPFGKTFSKRLPLKEDFTEAFTVFCNTESCDSIISFIDNLENDTEFKQIAKEILRKCNYSVAQKAHELAKAIWELEREK